MSSTIDRGGMFAAPHPRGAKSRNSDSAAPSASAADPFHSYHAADIDWKQPARCDHRKKKSYPSRTRAQSESDVVLQQQQKSTNRGVRRRHCRLRAYTEDNAATRTNLADNSSTWSFSSSCSSDSSSSSTSSSTSSSSSCSSSVSSGEQQQQRPDYSDNHLSRLPVGATPTPTTQHYQTHRMHHGTTPTTSNNNNPTAHNNSNANNNTSAVGVTSQSGGDNNSNNNTNNNNTNNPADDPERRGRMRWIQINRRFQLVITIVALVFSLLLLSILICWVVLTSAYVVSYEKSCDVPLKPYFWLVTFQLVLDVFRSDIMRHFFRWDASSNHQQRIPWRVIVYNLTYLLYAALVLRLGVSSVFVGNATDVTDADSGTTCRHTAPELFNASRAFVTLSLVAWGTIVCGYLLPFCIVAAMLTHNGYHPMTTAPAAGTVFPAAYSSMGAPPGCIERMPVRSVSSSTLPYTECCICLESFRPSDVMVETGCKHVFHKECCQEWLLQARSCPMCRLDIPSHLDTPLSEEEQQQQPQNGISPQQQMIPLGPTGRPVVGLLRMYTEGTSLMSSGGSGSTSAGPLRARSLSVPETSPDTVEEGRVIRNNNNTNNLYCRNT